MDRTRLSHEARPELAEHAVRLEQLASERDVLATVLDETAAPFKEIGHATYVDAKDLTDAAEWFYKNRNRSSFLQVLRSNGRGRDFLAAYGSDERILSDTEGGRIFLRTAAHVIPQLAYQRLTGDPALRPTQHGNLALRHQDFLLHLSRCVPELGWHWHDRPGVLCQLVHSGQ
jgi:hypothetical protein